jgi:predicted DNA-binding transcriptional regulator AlpA
VLSVSISNKTISALTDDENLAAPDTRREPTQVNPPPALLTKRDVLALIGVSYSTLFAWMRSGRFPLPLVLGPPGSRSSKIAWSTAEVRDWIANRPRRKFGARAER